MWISSAVSELTIRWTWPFFLTLRSCTPPLGLALTTSIVEFSVVGASDEPQPAATRAAVTAKAQAPRDNSRTLGTSSRSSGSDGDAEGPGWSALDPGAAGEERHERSPRRRAR